MVAVERVRTHKKSLNRLVELLEERIAGRQPVRLAGLHANAPEDARQILKQANGQFNAVEQIFFSTQPGGRDSYRTRHSRSGVHGWHVITSLYP